VRYRGLAKNTAQVMVLIELVYCAPEVGDGINIRIASGARKWPTLAPKTPVKSALETD
jgi:hypothetical protein